MGDDKANRDQQDRSRINLEQGYEGRTWAKRLGVSEEELTSAVHAVGRSADKVKEYLSKRKRPSRA
jgi:hypothetical protein